jgi:eukaryotic-like serine/threonine-protein kinase
VRTRHDHGIQEEDLFAAALALPASERIAYLKRACDRKTDLFDRLTHLIDVFGRATKFVGDDAVRAWDSFDHVGPYRLLQELGEGGCGIAYLAEQVAPVKREVAVKIIKPGMDTKAVIARFEAERQALALMDHPNVAKVFDAGATKEGRPYFVMELVRGIRITEYCDQSRLSISERLSLFIQVCQAIQHAHQKGIIHRDIKPSNVLVTMHDGSPMSKVIDFGIAKATRGRLIDQTLHTQVDQIMGTPAYISPEQAEAGQVAVDTRSDIYSLGVLLYELLTGQTPFDPHELAEASIKQLRERLQTEEPLRPSRRLATLEGALLSRIAGGSDRTRTKLVRQFRDELDWIAMRCLEKEPSRRYQTVNDLIADIERYLKHESVLARPPSFTYTVRKLARRNLVACASAVILGLFITGFAATMTIQTQRIAKERDQAERERENALKVSNVAMNVFALADPFHNLANGISASSLLDQAAKSIERELRDQPAARARLLQTLGRAYFRRAEYKRAIGLLKEAVEITGGTRGAEAEALVTMVDLSMALRNSGDFGGARKMLADAEELAKRNGLQRSAGYAKLLLNRGRLNLFETRMPAARSDFEESLHLYQRAVGPRSIEVAEALSDLSTALMWSDEFAEAERIAREAIEIFAITASPMYPDRVTTERVLADALYLQNHLDESESILLPALQKNTELFGADSEAVVSILDRLAMLRYSQRRLAEAEALSRDALAKAQIVFGKRHFHVASIAATLARTLIELRKYREAEATIREVLNVVAETLPPDHQQIASTEYLLGEVLLATNRLTEAEAVLTASMNRWKRSDAPPWRAMRSANALGEALYRQGRKAEGEEYLSESLRALSADPKADQEAKDKAKARATRYLRTTMASR